MTNKQMCINMICQQEIPSLFLISKYKNITFAKNTKNVSLFNHIHN
jgi:hypothetical protein